MFYCYFWLRENGTPYYVGKGKGYRAFVRHVIGNPPTDDRVLIQQYESEKEALQAEIFFISFYGRKDMGTGSLINLTDGGEGISNPAEEVRQKMRKSHIGKTPTKETREKMSKAQEGRKHSEASLHKMRVIHQSLIAEKSKALKGKPWTKERRAAYVPTPGVSFHKTTNKWRVREAGTGKHIGYFLTKEEAILAAISV